MAYGSFAGAHPRRTLIVSTLRAQPGMTLRRVSAATGIPMGSLRHHLAVLVAQNAMWYMQCGGSTLHYPGQRPVDDRGILAAHAASLTADLAGVLAFVRAHPGTRQKAVMAAFASTPRSTIQHHLARLLGYGMVVNRPGGRSHHLYPA